MRLKLYLDTSVLGAVCDPGPEDRLAATRRILDGLRAGSWDGYISVNLREGCPLIDIVSPWEISDEEA